MLHGGQPCPDLIPMIIHMAQLPTLRASVVILGDPGVGKTTLRQALYASRRSVRLPASHGKDECPVAAAAARGAATALTLRFTSSTTKQFCAALDLWEVDCATHTQATEDLLARLLPTAAIIMFDVTARNTYKNVPDHYRQIVRVLDCIPMVLVGNKVDSPDRSVKAKMITFHRKKNLQYYDMSAKARYNVEKPLMWLVKRLTSSADAALAGTTSPIVTPPEVRMPDHMIRELEEMLATSAMQSLPDDDE